MRGCSLRLMVWAPKPAGVAWVTDEVATSPVAIPLALAAAMMLRGISPFGVREMRPLLVLMPQAMALLAAAESVTRWSAELVRIKPAMGMRSI
ncbi:MAG: hypothetical protein BWY77_01828 [bacterium ADurb.Bin431]|nr:MAG: hypothetical protein BWY77_01828 [bacterium ADurb.Bin431]